MDQTAAFAALYDRFAGPLYRVALALLRSRPDAEDAVQEVFLGLARSRPSLDGVENVRAYLFSALRRAAARLAARRRADPLPALGPPAPAEQGADPELSPLLEQGLAALPAEQREVLSLKIDGALTFAEIAAVVGAPLKTVASRYRYALEKLRATLEAARHDPRPAAP